MTKDTSTLAARPSQGEKSSSNASKVERNGKQSQTFKVGDVVACKGNSADQQGGRVVGVYGDFIVFEEPSGQFDGWSASDLWLVWGSPEAVATKRNRRAG